VQKNHVGAARGGLPPPLYSDKKVARLLVRLVHRQAGLAVAVSPFDGGGGSPSGALLIQAVLAAGAHQGAAPGPGGSQRQAPCRERGRILSVKSLYYQYTLLILIHLFIWVEDALKVHS
jgi:hypothetical protein